MSSIAGVPHTVLVAPDSFKGTFTASEVAEAIGAGLRQRDRPVDLCPIADGGEGTLDALAPALGADLREADATDPLGRPLRARFAVSEASSEAVVETAAV